MHGWESEKSRSRGWLQWLKCLHSAERIISVKGNAYFQHALHLKENRFLHAVISHRVISPPLDAVCFHSAPNNIKTQFLCRQSLCTAMQPTGNMCVYKTLSRALKCNTFPSPCIFEQFVLINTFKVLTEHLNSSSSTTFSQISHFRFWYK